MRHLLFALLLPLAACSDRSPTSSVPLEPPTPALAAWKPSLRLADNALANGAPAVALRVADGLLAKDAHDSDAMVRRGEALSALGRNVEAAASYAKAIDGEPRNTRALIGLGRIQLTQNAASAEALFARAIKQEPNNAAALADLGVARDMQGHHTAAQEAYRMALGAAPASIPVQVNLGLSMALSGKAADAVRLLKPIATGPETAPRIRQDLAVALAMNGQKEEATSVLRRDMSAEQARRAMDGFEALRP